MKISFTKFITSWAHMVLITSLLLSSCISQNKVKLLQEKTAKQATTEFANAKNTTYRLQTGDHLYIEVYSVDPKTSKFFQTDFPDLMNPTYLYLKSYSVDEFGYINFSFVDKLFVKGLTVAEVKEQIQKTLNEYFKESNAVVKLVNFEVSVIGEVNNPGSFTIYRDQLNLFQALGLAGGMKDFGNPKKIKLVRQTQTGSNLVELDLSDNKILESPYFYMQPNDIVYVEPLNAKSWSYSRFPYETILVLISTALVGYNILIK
ncbi:MAG TPA: polysaccharide biosynthesis/export family protein [Bacteroidales bacterium]|nr:polysaccharide biosynthesis/export family protein [Bacteroidales bacterium]